MGKFYFAFAWDKIVNLHVCICKSKICIWSDPGVNLPICKLLRCVFAFACAICLPRVKFAHQSIFTCVYFWRMRIGLWSLIFYWSCRMGKPAICIGKNKGADQLGSNCEADKHLHFRSTDRTIPLLSKSKISSL